MTNIDTVIRSYPLAIVRGTDGRDYLATERGNGFEPIALLIEPIETPTIDDGVCPRIIRERDECHPLVAELLRTAERVKELK